MQRRLLISGLMAVVLCVKATAHETPGSNARPDKNAKVSLPGLAVSLGMSVDEVAFQFQNMTFRHLPEKRWQKNGHSFRIDEQIHCFVVPLRELNEQLLEARFVFDQHTLQEVNLTIINAHNAIRPLIKPLQLVEVTDKPGTYRGLKGKIVMRADVGNAEKTTWVIRRAE